MNTDQWIAIIEIAIVIIGALAGINQLRLVGRQLRRDAARERVNRALEFSASRNILLRNAVTEVNEILDKNLEGKTLSDKNFAKIVNQLLDTDPNFETRLRMLLAQWENLALSISAGSADEDIAFEMFRGTILEDFRKYQPYIERVRKKNERKYVYLERLVKRWQRLHNNKRRRKKLLF